MPRLGISSLEDITALDSLGLPVVLSSRPRGKTLRLHSGKGLLVADARAGALMEAVEYAVAENSSARGPDVWLPFGELAAALPVGLRLADFAPRLGVAPPGGQRTPGVYCEEVGSRTKALLPAELVLVPSPSADGALPLYGWSTNGLASGNTLEETTLHALLEVVERDSIAMNLSRDESSQVPVASLPTPFGRLIAPWQSRGIELLVRFLPNAFGLACFEAAIHEPARHHVRLVRGWGCHFDRDVALSRAVCEAAQLRLSVIHPRWRRQRRRYGDAAPGTKSAAVGRMSADAKGDRLLIRAADRSRQLDFSEVPHESCSSVRSALTDLFRRLAAAGMTRVFRHRMYFDGDPEALLGLHVVKVIVPLCESAVGAQVRMGPRLLERVMGI